MKLTMPIRALVWWRPGAAWPGWWSGKFMAERILLAYGFRLAFPARKTEKFNNYKSVDPKGLRLPSAGSQIVKYLDRGKYFGPDSQHPG
jgi:hypothetical protein